MTVQNFTLHNNRGQTVLEKELLSWIDPLHHPSGIFGPVVQYSWTCNAVDFVSDNTGFWKLLPDASGFICFEPTGQTNNCVLIDGKGHVRRRLSVPIAMTGAKNPESSTFGNVDGPFINPENGQLGKFGVSAWLDQSKFYFELDYQNGQFLWCRSVRD